MFSLMGNCLHCIIEKRRPKRRLVFVMVGLDNAGKTCIAKALKGDLIDNVAPTIGFANIEFAFKRCNVIIYDLGGGNNIRNIWKNYFAEAHGLIYVIDASDADRLFETKAAMKNVISNPRVAGKPVLILANKQDKEGALDEIDLCEHLELEQLANSNKCPTRVETCSIMLGQGRKLDHSIQEGFAWLVEVVRGDYEHLEKRVEHEISLQRLTEERQKQERIARVKREREMRAETVVNTSKEDEADVNGDPFKPISEAIKYADRNLTEGAVEVKKRRKKKGKNRVVPSDAPSETSKQNISLVPVHVEHEQLRLPPIPSTSTKLVTTPPPVRRKTSSPPPAHTSSLHTPHTNIRIINTDSNDDEDDDIVVNRPSDAQSNLPSAVTKLSDDSAVESLVTPPTISPPHPVPVPAPRRNKSEDSGVDVPEPTPSKHHLPVIEDDAGASDSSSLDKHRRRKKKKRFQRSNRTNPAIAGGDGAGHMISSSGEGDPAHTGGLGKLPPLPSNGSVVGALPPLRALGSRKSHLLSPPRVASHRQQSEIVMVDSDNMSSKWGLADELEDSSNVYRRMPNSESLDVLT